MLTVTRPRDGLAALRRFVSAQAVERCELCGVAIAAEHDHVMEPAARRMLCACRACASAFAGQQGRYRSVPRDTEALSDFAMSEAEWRSLDLPIDMAFLFHSTPQGGPVALYPGPLGATESLPSPEAWAALLARNPVLAELEPDVEALLVNRVGGRRACWRVPIDRCFALVGLIRSRWQGWSGGDEVWQAIDQYCAALGAPAAGRGA